LGPVLFFFGLLILGAFLGTFNMFFMAPCIGLSFAVSLGYGADSLTNKLWKRLICGVMVGACGLAAGLIADETVLGIAQMLLSISASILIGSFNPVKAPVEEALIATLSTVLIPFML
jgi:hypothetical protein